MRKTFLLILVLLGTPAISLASLEAGQMEQAPFSSANEKDSQLVLANTTAVNVALQKQLQLTTGGAGESSNNKGKNVPVPTAGIIFATFLFGAGVFVGRKKKAKTSGVVGAFARSN